VEAAAETWQCDIAEVLDLSTGLHPAGEPAWLGEWLKEHAALVGHYPDSNGEPARSALAQEFAVKPENILITAGAQATIEVIFQAMGWQSMAIQIPCYNEPIRCARRSGCEVHAYETGHPPDADMLWMTSPSNPFGAATDFPQGTRGVLDESYMPFSGRRSLKLVPDVIRIGSLTKTFCIPGLRLGYVIADAAIINQLDRWLPPWPASTPGLHLLPRLLPEADRRDQQIMISRTRLTALLESFDWQVKLSEASFLMAKPHSGPMPAFSHHRILVRQFPEWPQLAGWVRFGLPGNEAAWQRLEEALCR
jgi:histidinol-phosphate/aromatic aminotransferase/cobyric acid decarboxylase-like protein